MLKPRRLAALASLPLLVAAGACSVTASNTVVDGLARAQPVTTVKLGTGGSGDVTVLADNTVTGVDVRRTVHYVQSKPGQTARFDGDTLVLDLDCGLRCSVSYEVRVPAGVAVSGEASSGDITLRGVGTVDIGLSSGNVLVERASGAVSVRSTSGDVTLTGVAGPVTVHSTSGDVRATDLAGSPDRFDVTSGTTEVGLTVPADVSVTATSGDIDVTVPAGSYRVSARSTSGDVALGVTDNPAGVHSLDLSTTSGDVTVALR